MNKLIVLVVAIIIGLLATFWQGYVLAIIWSWFMVPLGVMVMTHYQCTGIMVIAGFLKTSIKVRDVRDEATENEYISMFVMAFIWPLLSLFSGWIIHRIIG